MEAFDSHIADSSRLDIGTNLTLHQKWNWHVILGSSANSSVTKGKDKLILAQQVKNLTHYLELEGSLQFSKQAASTPFPKSNKSNLPYAL
jgi:hypothetical protein